MNSDAHSPDLSQPDLDAPDLESPDPEAPERRVVLLGASNVVRNIRHAVDTARDYLGGPLDIFISAGHGRSYGLTSRVVWRTLEGITQAGLWHALESRPAAPTWALLTDVGNDLLYDATPEQIVGWVETCVDRLAGHDAQITLSQLPVENIDTLGPVRFCLMRSVLFPSCKLSFETILGRAREVVGGLAELASRRRLELVEQPASWYGIDPIHYRRRHTLTAWQTLLASWGESCEGSARHRGRRRYLYLKTRRFERTWWFGKLVTTLQPCGKLSDGSLVWMY